MIPQTCSAFSVRRVPVKPLQSMSSDRSRAANLGKMGEAMVIRTMATQGPSGTGQDLASLACQAALEFDNLILKRSSQLNAASELFAQIRQRVTDVAQPASASSLLDPTTAVVLNRAVKDVSGPTDGQLEQLLVQIREMSEIVTGLTTADPSAEKNVVQLGKLRTFCLAVSRHASAVWPNPFERPEQPFRR